ncbi:MAG: FAD-dependent oxidoreductase [Alphaproteobacteria bacterium]
MADPYDVIVAGGGIAGLTAGLRAAELGRRTLVLTGPLLGGNLLAIESVEGWPGAPDGIAGYELCPSVQEQASAAGADFAMEEIDAIAPGDGVWTVTAGGTEFGARALIVATGAAFRPLGVEGETRLIGRGVSHCASCDAPLLRGRRVAVIGGGDSACQEALTLAGAASHVTILTHGERLSAQATFCERVHAAPNIEIRTHCEVREILGDDTVAGLNFADRQSGAVADLEADAVFIYIGLRPSTSFLQGHVALDSTGQVPVDAMMRSETQGLLAAGLARRGAAGRAAASAEDGNIAAKAADRYLNGGAWRDS